ncbi:MAG: hypothetical protein GIW95_11140 [Candidatus Eremiobacteraeota bacterium]|nr:hypothetical protein [Candidatus Eremiobacteraeota bacterium]
MSPSREDRRRLFTSLGLSTVLQIPLAFIFFAATMLWYAVIQEEQPLGLPAHDRAGVTMFVIEHRARAASSATERQARSVALAPKHRDVKARPHTISRDVKILSVMNRASKVERVASARRAVNATRATLQAAKAPVDDSPTDPIPSVAASPQPSAAPAVTTAALTSTQQIATQRGSEGPVGGWGQNFEKPMLADDAVLSDLRAKYHFASAIVVRVDENGKALKVTLPDSIPSDARAEIEKRLVALHYVPAECNGLRCIGTLQITL